jgi:hypothetical protein
MMALLDVRVAAYRARHPEESETRHGKRRGRATGDDETGKQRRIRELVDYAEMLRALGRDEMALKVDAAVERQRNASFEARCAYGRR